MKRILKAACKELGTAIYTASIKELAAISSGEPAGSDYSYVNGGNLVVENCTIQNSKYGIYLGKGENASAELKSAEFEGNDSDIYLASNKKITISDTFTTKANIIKVAAGCSGCSCFPVRRQCRAGVPARGG